VVISEDMQVKLKSPMKQFDPSMKTPKESDPKQYQHKIARKLSWRGEESWN
jgi:hypothetical protein